MSTTNVKFTNGNDPVPGRAPASAEGPREPGAHAPRDGTNFEQLLMILLRRWPLIVGSVVIVAAAAVGFSLLQQNEYTASASLLFRNTQFDQELFGANFTSSSVVDPTRDAATNIDLASLPTVASRTAAALHLPPGLVRSEISVSGVGQANVAQISATDPDP